MDDLDKLIMKNMEDPTFRKLWIEEEPKYAIVHNIIKQRNRLNMTEEELAYKSRINVKTIREIEFGEYEVNDDMLQKIAEALETNVEELTGQHNNTDYEIDVL